MLKIEALTNQLPLGRQGENKAIQIVFDPLKLFGLSSVDGYSFTLVNRRPSEAAGYPVINIEVEENKILWTVRDVDNAISGSGEAQLNCFKGDTLYKSFTYTTIISPSIDGTGDVPGPYEDIIDQITGIYNDTVTIKDEVEGLKTAAEEAARTAIESRDLTHVYELRAKEYSETAEGFSTAARTASAEANYYSGVASNAAERADSAAAESITNRDAADAAAVLAGERAAAAAGSAADAANDADEAGRYATAAAGSAESAEEDRLIAAQAAINAEASATQAASSALSIERFLPTDTASGAVASLPDGANNVDLISLISNIEAIQSGSGNPAPDNVRPISGWTGVKITRAGKNLLDVTTAEISGNIVWYDSLLFKGGITYTFSVPSNVGSISIYDTTKTTQLAYASTAKSVSYTPTIDTPGYPRLYTSGGVSEAIYNSAQIETGSTATTYEAYRGNVYNVALDSDAGTVYGGTLDVISGVLTVTHKLVNSSVLSGSGLSERDGVYRMQYTLTPKATNDYFLIKSNVLKTANLIASSGWENNSICTYSGNALVSGDSTCDTVQKMETYLNNLNCQLLYPLATPVTYELTPIEVKSLLGVNNIYSDTGNVSATYKADIQLYIDKRLSGNRNLLSAPSPVVEPEEEIEHRSDNILNVISD